jgi:hypothetical protein
MTPTQTQPTTPVKSDKLARLVREHQARLARGKVVVSMDGKQAQDAPWLNSLRKRLMSLG